MAEYKYIEVKQQNIEKVYHSLFSRIFFKNKVVATIIYNTGKDIGRFKFVLDKKLNTDI
jgi:hypothetical protein